MSETDIILTDRAAKHVKGYLAKNDTAIGLRVGVKPTGCSGYKYIIESAENCSASDTSFESNGVKIIVDELSLPYLKGTKLDYVRQSLNDSFKFSNPNVQETCGCGESFSVSDETASLPTNREL